LIESIVFSLGEITFGITINQIGHLRKPGSIDPIDGAPDWISGFSTYKDRVLPYIQFWKIPKIHHLQKKFYYYLMILIVVHLGYPK